MATRPGVEEPKDIASTSLRLVRLLCPAPASSFTAGGPGIRAWSCSLLTVAQLAAQWADQEVVLCSSAEEKVILGNVISLRILIEQMQPVLCHVASLTRPVSHISAAAEDGVSSLGSASATGRQDPQQGNLLNPATSSVGSSGICEPRDCSSLYPADSTLQLLTAAGALAASAVRLASRNPVHYTVLAGGLQYIGRDTLRLTDGSSDDMLAALDAVLSLAHTLVVVKGTWWQKAKAHHPLLLVETLHMLAKVGSRFCQGVSPALPPAWSGLLYTAQLKSTGLLRSVVLVCCWSHIAWCVGRVCLASCLQSLAAVVGAANGFLCRHEPGTCSCHVVQSHIIGWGGPGPRAESSSATFTAPGGIRGASTAAATVATITTASSCSNSGNGWIQAGCLGPLNAPSLVATVAADLWALLSDPSITGAAPRPATWMQPTSMLLLDSTQHLQLMLEAIDSTSGQCIDSLKDEQLLSSVSRLNNLIVGRDSSSNSASGGKGTAMYEALQLMSLVPHVPWSQLQAPVWRQPYVRTDAVHSHCMSGVRMAQMMLRAVCALGAAGFLTEGHSRGVVALLGGLPRGSSNTDNSGRCQSSLLIEEPRDIQLSRLVAGISSAELCHTILIESRHPRVAPLFDHLVQAFGEDQLPDIAAYHRTSCTSGAQQRASLDSRMQERWCMLKEQGVFDAYLSWVQETLLLVISEVVSSHQPTPCPVVAPSNQRGS
jgi:hypothetical protein